MSQYSPTQIEELTALGSYLRQQREQRSLTIEAVAEGTFVRQPLLEAIETGNSDRLPEVVYVQGFIRRYGDFLGLDGTKLAHSLSRDPTLNAEKLTPEMVALPLDADAKESPTAAAREKIGKLPTKTRSSQPLPLTPANQPDLFSKLAPYWVYILALGAAIAGLYSFFSRPDVPPVATPPPADNQSVSEPQASFPTPPSPAPIAKNSVIEAKVELIGDSWLKVEADGEKVYEGVLIQGEQKTWTAQKSLSIRSGNAGAVSLSVNQQPPKPLGQFGKVAEVILKPESKDF
jgi:cytoskeleton protein RodZ